MIGIAQKSKIKTRRYQFKDELTVFRRGGLGDIILLLPIIKELNKRVKVNFVTSDIMVEFLDLFELPFSVNRIDENNIEMFSLHGVIDYMPYCSERHRIDLFISEIQHSIFEDFNVSDKEITLVPKKGIKLKKRVAPPSVAICPIATAPIRSWDYWDELSRELINGGYNVYLLAEDRLQSSLKNKRFHNLSGKLGMRELVEVIYSIDKVISVDSGPFHLAYALNKPVIGMFGPILAKHRIPFGNKKFTMLQDGSGCPHFCCWDWQVGNCNGKPFYKKCMQNITVANVVEATKNL